MTNSLQDKALLITLNISTWSPRKKDQHITDQLNNDHNCDDLTVNKQLINAASLKEITTAKGDARTDHYAKSVTWSDKGQRIISTPIFTDYYPVLHERKAKFDAMADEFASKFDALVDAERHKSTFNADDYPTDIRSKFKFEFDSFPLPPSDLDDIRINIGEQAHRELTASMAARQQAAIDTMEAEIFSKVAKSVNAIATKLNDYKPATDTHKEKDGFHNSLITNAQSLIDILPAQNITDNPAISKLVKDLGTLTNDDAATLKQDSTKRKATAAKAKKIALTVNDMLA